MSQDKSASVTDSCPDCGASRARGVCPACAFGALLMPREEFDEQGEGAEAPSPQAEATAASWKGDIEFGRYLLTRRIASGGMGIVYEALDQKLKRTVALKMIRGATFADEAELARFTLETEAAASLDHPNIVPIYEVGRMDGQPFFTMKLIEGQSLAEMLRETGSPVTPRGSAQMLAAVARAVHHAHQRGVLHRDLKPGNILLDRDKKPWLTDFGLAKIGQVDSGLTQSADRLGTPAYMAPEIAGSTARCASTASDVWALGVLLWEMLSGSQPFRGGGPVEVMRRIVEDDPQWTGSRRVDGDLLTIAQRCMEKNPLKRPGSAGEVADELERWLRGEPIRARRVSVQERVLKWIRRKPAVAGLYAAMTVGAVAATVLWQRAETAVVGLTQTNDQLAHALRISRATKLAADARLQLSEDPGRALLLAVKSVEMTEDSPVGVLPEAASALTSVLQNVGGFDLSPRGAKPRSDAGYFARSWEQENFVQISPDSRWVITMQGVTQLDEGLDVALFDLQSPRHGPPLRSWHIPTETLHCFRPYSGWLADSQHFYTISHEGDVTIWSPLQDRAATAPPHSRALGRIVPRTGVALTRLMTKPKRDGSVECVMISRQSETPVGPHFFTSVRITDASLTWSDPIELPEVAPGAEFCLSPSGNYLACHNREVSKEEQEKGLRPWLWLMNRRGAQPSWAPVNLPEVVDQIQFTAPETHLVMRGSSYRLSMLELKNANLQLPPTAKRLSYVADTAAYRCDVSQDGRWMAQCTIDAFGGRLSEFSLIPLFGGDSLRLSLESGECYCVRFSPDGNWIAAGGDRGGVSVWNLEEIRKGRSPKVFRGLASRVVEISFSPDSQHLVAMGADFQVRQWSVKESNSGSHPAVVPVASNNVQQVAHSPDGRMLACAGFSANKTPGKEADETDAVTQGQVLIVDPESGLSRHLAHHDSQATGVAFSADGKWLASTGLDGLAKVWLTSQLQPFLSAGGSPPAPKFQFFMEETRLHYERRLAFHPRGALYCACGDGFVFEWDLTKNDPGSSRKKHWIHTLNYLLPDLTVSPDGKWLAVARHGWDAQKAGAVQFGNQVLLHDVSQPGEMKPVVALPGCFVFKTMLAISPDSRWLAAGGAGLPTRVWDLQASHIEKSVIEAPVSAPFTCGVGFSPDGKWLALSGSDGQFHLWDWRRSGNLRSFTHRDVASALTYLPSGKLVLGGSAGSLSIFDMNTDRLKVLARRVAGRELNGGEQLRFSTSLTPQ